MNAEDGQLAQKTIPATIAPITNLSNTTRKIWYLKGIEFMPPPFDLIVCAGFDFVREKLISSRSALKSSASAENEITPLAPDASLFERKLQSNRLGQIPLAFTEHVAATYNFNYSFIPLDPSSAGVFLRGLHFSNGPLDRLLKFRECLLM